MVVLLFGFEKFSKYHENPSEIIINRLNGSVIENQKIIGIVLPVEFNKIEEIIVKNMQETRPYLTLGIGVAPGRTKITPEKIAVNYKYSKEPDNAGIKYSGQKIDLTQPDGIFSELPVERLVDYLNLNGIPAEISLSAGSFLCNMAMFIILRECKKIGCKGGFIHIPCHEKCIEPLEVTNTPIMPLDTILQGIILSIKFYLKNI
jgi:pyroglutamyl-peptidase